MGWSNSFSPLGLKTRRMTCTSPSAFSSAFVPPDSKSFAFAGGRVEETISGNVAVPGMKNGGLRGRRDNRHAAELDSRDRKLHDRREKAQVLLRDGCIHQIVNGDAARIREQEISNVVGLLGVGSGGSGSHEVGHVGPEEMNVRIRRDDEEHANVGTGVAVPGGFSY